jgi:hypothetical protein
MASSRWTKQLCRAVLTCIIGCALSFLPGRLTAAGDDELRLPNTYIPYKSDAELPAPTPPILELGDPFLGTGNLAPGTTLPGGAVWQPRFWVYGNARTALQTYDTGEDNGQVFEWVNRLDLFGNLQLTGTERILIGVQPLHRDSDFTGQVFKPENSADYQNVTNLRLRTLFFEGDFGEIFPHLDPLDAKRLDFGFSVGRQQLSFQDGILINDVVDAVGVTRNSVRIPGVPWITNIRITGLWGWNEIHRDDNVDDPDANLFGLFTAIDTPPSTVEIDFVHVNSKDDGTGDLWNWGVGTIQRIGLFNTSLRVNGSIADDRTTAQSDDGHLVFGEISWTPTHTHNLAYVNGFLCIDNFSSAARDPTAGGPLGRTGILFAARGIGTFPAPLGNRSDESYGIAAGYQMFFDNNRRQLIVEAGARHDDTASGNNMGGLACRFQQALGRRVIFQLDGYVTDQEHLYTGYGMRSELTVLF